MSANPTSPPSREELYARVRATSRTAVSIEEMKRLGFWSADDQSLSEADALLRRESELSAALAELGQELRVLGDPAEALKRMRKERMAEAKARREETRQRRARERHERALAWHARKSTDVTYLGEGVSAGLNDTRSDPSRLAALTLPALRDAQDLARAMGLSLQELRFLAFDRRVSRISHYRRFAMPKKTGGERIISAPMPRLKRAQYWVLDNVLARVPVHAAAHGFLKGRSIVSNAAPHVGRAVVINVDLKDFFPSIGMPRVKGVFAQLGYSEQVATLLALLCTEAATEEVSIDGETFHVAHGPRALPQGAPSSPALTNALCRRLDARLLGAAAKLGFSYTRYADDLTFSADESARKLAGKLLWRVKQIVVDEGFTPHPDKQHVMGRGARQSVTGIVVNAKPAVDRDTLRRFRATLYQVEKDGPAGKQWNGNDNVLAALEGYAHFVRMVDPAKGGPLVLRVRAVRAAWSESAERIHDTRPRRAGGQFRQLSAAGKAPWDGFWQASPGPAPVLEKTQQQIDAKRDAQRETARRAAHAKLEDERRAAREASRAGFGHGGGSRPPTVEQPAPRPQTTPQQDHEQRAKSRRATFVLWNSIALQLFMSLNLSQARSSILPFVAALVVAGVTLHKRRTYWIPYFLLMFGVWLVLKNS